MKSLFLLVLLCTAITPLFSNDFENIETSISIDEILISDINLDNFESSFYINLQNHKDSNVNKTKLVAIALAITLGAFGVHRLYLGTEPIVPIAYTLTLGGGFLILPLIDIFYIISAEDINQITNNNNVFIWNKDLEEEEVQETQEDL